MMKFLKIGVLLWLPQLAFSQGQAINQVSGPTPNSYIYYFDTGSTPQFVCQAQAYQPLVTFYKSSGTLTQIAVATNVATATFSSTSYMWTGMQITVAGSATSALNATYKVTGTSGSTATFATSGVSDGTYTDANLTISTNHPLLNALVWAIQVTQYNGSNPLTQYWAGVPSPVPGMRLACSNRSQY